MKNIIILLAMSAIFFSCKKEKVAYTITGQFLPCTGYNNTDIYEIYQKKNGSNVNAEILATTKTDANGNFSFTYTTSNLNDKLTLRQSSGFGYSEIIGEINLGDISNLIIGRPLYHLILSLNVTKPYTSNDTLFIRRATLYNPIDFKIAGPFTNGRLLSKINLSYYPEVIFGGTFQVLEWGMKTPNYNEFQKDYNVPRPTKCSGDSVYLSLDIK
jgi:hypothetical protein